LIKQILCNFYKPEPIYTRRGHRVSDFWHRLSRLPYIQGWS